MKIILGLKEGNARKKKRSVYNVKKDVFRSKKI